MYLSGGDGGVWCGIWGGGSEEGVESFDGSVVFGGNVISSSRRNDVMWGWVVIMGIKNKRKYDLI